MGIFNAIHVRHHAMPHPRPKRPGRGPVPVVYPQVPAGAMLGFCARSAYCLAMGAARRLPRACWRCALSATRQRGRIACARLAMGVHGRPHARAHAHVPGERSKRRQIQLVLLRHPHGAGRAWHCAVLRRCTQHCVQCHVPITINSVPWGSRTHANPGPLNPQHKRTQLNPNLGVRTRGVLYA